ncbi:hypothetical protein FQR65_LT00798 [Abscondita terminalis]|nr:hypothetical protein FQR65_LT00798 [Abscondita terminalis]
MSSQRRKILKPEEIVSSLNNILEDESDGEPLEYSDDEYELENSSNSSSDESDNTIHREIPQVATNSTEAQNQVSSQRRGRGRAVRGRRGRQSVEIEKSLEKDIEARKDNTVIKNVEWNEEELNHYLEQVLESPIGVKIKVDNALLIRKEGEKKHSGRENGVV